MSMEKKLRCPEHKMRRNFIILSLSCCQRRRERRDGWATGLPHRKREMGGEGNYALNGRFGDFRC